MTLRDKLGHYHRIRKGMQEFLRTPLPSDWESRIRMALDRRESTWLETLNKVVFSQPEHPYRKMFDLAGCTYSDLSQMVGRRGLEFALAELRRGGVWLDHDEFKGTTPIVRSGTEIPATPASFANPLVWGWFRGSSGASRSSGTVTTNGTEQLAHLTGYAALNIEEFQIRERPYVIVRPPLPSIAGLLFCMLYSQAGCRVGPWFAFGGKVSDSLHYRALTNYVVALARWHGAPASWPTHLPPDDFSPVARWIAGRRSRGIACTLQAVASTGVRVASAALEHGLDISGTLMFSGGETLTDSKRRVIESAGVAVYPAYWISEIGQIGHSCRHMNAGDSVHVFRDSVAVIGEPKQIPHAEVEVNSLLFTTLSACAPNVFINVEMQDAGILGERRCDCVFSKLGFTQEISDLGSYGKLSGHGMTLVGSDVVRILEHDLPARFGGGPGDYQLLEQEGSRQTELYLRVSPRVRVESTEAVKSHFLRLLREHHGGALASRVWEYTGALKVVIAEPLLTRAGKLLPLHLGRLAASAAILKTQ
jgi:hypothetical protein